MMTDNDRRLIDLAYEARSTDHEYLRSLIPRADTEEARRKLADMESDAFIRSERAYFDREDPRDYRDYDDYD